MLPTNRAFLLTVVVLVQLCAVTSGITWPECAGEIASYACHASSPTCNELSLGRITNTLPLGRGFDMALSSNLYRTRKPHVFELSYCASFSKVGSIFKGFRMPCEAKPEKHKTPIPDRTGTVSVYESTQTYANSLGSTFGVSAAALPYAFSASASGTWADLRERHGATARTSVTSTVGTARLDNRRCLALTGNYKRCFDQLSHTDPTDPAYTTLFTEFGTHVITWVKIGGQQEITSTVNQCAMQRIKKTYSSVQIGLGKFLSIAAGTKTSSNAFEELQAAEVSYQFIGGNASLHLPSQWDQYEASVLENQAVFEFRELMPLYSTVENAGPLPDTDTFRATFEAATMIYLKSVRVEQPNPVDCESTD
eukprot:scpid60158/ scgid20115/ 